MYGKYIYNTSSESHDGTHQEISLVDTSDTKSKNKEGNSLRHSYANAKDKTKSKGKYIEDKVIKYIRDSSTRMVKK